MVLEISSRDVEIVAEALAMAAARHESMGHKTKGRFRYTHDAKAERMRELRREIVSKLKEASHK